MIPVDKVREIIKKHEILEKELSSGKIEKKLFASKSKGCDTKNNRARF